MTRCTIIHEVIFHNWFQSMVIMKCMSLWWNDYGKILRMELVFKFKNLNFFWKILWLGGSSKKIVNPSPTNAMKKFDLQMVKWNTSSFGLNNNPTNVWNVDDASLFWKLKFRIFGYQEIGKDYKWWKRIIDITLCTNMNGFYWLSPFIIYQYKIVWPMPLAWLNEFLKRKWCMFFNLSL
jgi:hypothetical protein